jgi:hypothetical protein
MLIMYAHDPFNRPITHDLRRHTREPSDAIWRTVQPQVGSSSNALAERFDRFSSAAMHRSETSFKTQESKRQPPPAVTTCPNMHQRAGKRSPRIDTCQNGQTAGFHHDVDNPDE